MKTPMIIAALAGFLGGAPASSETMASTSAAPSGEARRLVVAEGATATSPGQASAVKLGIYVRLEAKPGQERNLEEFLKSALALAQREPATPIWFALKFGPRTFGIFDAFVDEEGREAHLKGDIATALMANADRLLAAPPRIEKIELLAAKMPA